MADEAALSVQVVTPLITNTSLTPAVGVATIDPVAIPSVPMIAVSAYPVLAAVSNTGGQGPQGPAGEPGVSPSAVPGPTGPPGVNPRGPWQNTIDYAVADAVTHNDALYIAIDPNIGSEPPSDPWLLLLPSPVAVPINLTDDPDAVSWPLVYDGSQITPYELDITALARTDSGNTFESATEFAAEVDLDDDVNVVLGTANGSQIGTGATQKLGFWGATPIVQPTVTGLRYNNAALASLLTKLALEGLIVDSSTNDGSYTQYTNAPATNTTTETSLFASTLTLPANFLIVGRVVRLRWTGYISVQNASGQTLTWRVKLGSTTLPASMTTALTQNQTTQLVMGEFMFICSTTGSSSTGRVKGGGQVRCGADVLLLPMVNSVAVDTTTALVLNLTAQWGAASANNALTINLLTVEVLN